MVRAHGMIDDPAALRAMTAFIYFMKGAMLVYNGEEKGDAHHVTLFDKDLVDWNGDIDLTDLLKKMHEIKQLPIMAEGSYEAKEVRKGVLEAVHSLGEGEEEEQLIGLFNTTGKKQAIPTQLPEGIYKNLYDGSSVQVYEGVMRIGEITIIEK